MTSTESLSYAVPSLIRLLTEAHRRMDRLGYPPAGARPLERHFCSACGRWSEEES
jgi:hypothetical protein